MSKSRYIVDPDGNYRDPSGCRKVLITIGVVLSIGFLIAITNL